MRELTLTRHSYAAMAVLLLSASGPSVAAQAVDAADRALVWNWNPLLGLTLALIAWRYMDGVWTLWRRSGTRRSVTRGHVAAFWGGIVTLFVALISPIDALGEALFSAHMVQHMLLMLVAAPLLVVGMPPAALAWAMPQPWRRPAAQWWHQRSRLREVLRFVSQPVMAWLVFAVVLWIWHLPALYQAALREPSVHVIEHATFLGAALLYWWSLPIHSGRRAHSHGMGMLSVFTTALHSSVLGVLLTISPRLWYADYASTTAVWGLTPLEDQQLAGLIMWVPSGILFLAAILALLALWLHRMEQQTPATAD